MERINEILQQRGAWLMREKPSLFGDEETARRRSDATRYISSHYEEFQPILRSMVHPPQQFRPKDNQQGKIVDLLVTAKILIQSEDTYIPRNGAAKTYLTGGWLEELTYLAVMEAGADAAVFAQHVGWEVGDYSGRNEIDTIARVGDKLSFISCKSMRPDYVPGKMGKSTRQALMNHLGNADDLEDHFGDSETDNAALVVSMDLIDEEINWPRYVELFGKAAKLDVDIVSLDDFKWETLVERMRRLLFE